MSGLFATFNTAKSGLGVSQANISVTSHNISNSNTVGYSRQRAKVVTSRPSSNAAYGQVGTGAQVQAIERIRDTFGDYQISGESSKLGKADVRNEVLYEVETIFNEPSDTGISTLIGEFFDAFQELSKQPNSSNIRTVVAQQTLALTEAMNDTYRRLEELQENSQSLLKINAVDIISILNQIDAFNTEIKSVSALGQNANDLMDARDNLLDELSYKFNITIDKTAYDGVNVSATDKNGMASSVLVSSDGSKQSARLSYISDIKQDPSNDGVYIVSYYKLGDSTDSSNLQTIRISGLTEEKVKEMEASRLIWANEEGMAVKADGSAIKDNAVIDVSELMLFQPSSGEVAGNISVQQDVQEYMDQLDKLAVCIAYSVNSIHSGMSASINPGGDPDMDYLPFFVNSDVAKYNSNGEVSNLYETLTAENKITAKNITINKEILNDVMKIKTKTHDNEFSHTSYNDIDGEGDGARALAIAKLRESLINIQDIGTKINSRADLKLSNYGMTIESNNTGTTIDAYYQDIIDRLGVQAQEAARQVSNQEIMLSELENTRLSISGVSLDEEMANLIQFQHAYSANAKMISTLDELLDVVINGLKR